MEIISEQRRRRRVKYGGRALWQRKSQCKGHEGRRTYVTHRKETSVAGGSGGSGGGGGRVRKNRRY